MRPLELATLLALAVAVLARAGQRTHRLRGTRWLTVLALAPLGAHLLVEGARWPLAPAYLLAALLATRSLARAPVTPPGPGRYPLRHAVRVTLALAVLGASALLAAGFPVFTYPAPSGPHSVGTMRLAFVDRTRDDPFAPAPRRPRELLASVWYPADVAADAPRAPFWPGDTDASAAIGLPRFLFSHLALVRSHAAPDAPLARAQQRWPVVIFSHGFNSTPWQNVVQMEELASHGFVVVSLGHPYDASRLTFPDGHVVLDNSRTRPPQPSPPDQAAAMRLAALVDSAREPDSVRARWRRTEEHFVRVGVYVMASVEVWYDDTRFLMDRLAAIDAGTDRETAGPRERLAGRLDLQRLGVAGMSFGGSTAGITCARDPRCRAGANLDGWQFGRIMEHPLAVPFLFVTRDGNAQLPVYFGASADLVHVAVRGATHGSFGDLAIAMPLFRWIARPGLALLGTIDGASIERIMSRYLVAFFRQYLLGEAQPLLAATPPPDDLTDATLTVVPPPARLAPRAPAAPSAGSAPYATPRRPPPVPASPPPRASPRASRPRGPGR